MKRQPFSDDRVAQVFSAYPTDLRKPLLALRELVYHSAHTLPGVGQLEETLKWNEPSYLTSRPKSGTTLRLAPKDGSYYGLFVHCQTSLISDFRQLYPELAYDGNRGMLFARGVSPPAGVAEHFIEAALTYHSARRLARQRA